MEIWIGSLLECATNATAAVAMIDVFRAFTTAAVALANGASRIIMVQSVDQALFLRNSGIGQVCIGEVKGHLPPEFDFGNSPFEMSETEFHGTTAIQRTSAGTQGIIAATHADRLYAAAFVTAKATARALASGTENRITLVAMGDKGKARTDEDELCALHLRTLLNGRTGNPEATRQLILASSEVQRFRDPLRPDLHQDDVNIALDIDRYDFAVRGTIEDSYSIARLQRPS